jgi:hypothetical protein
MLEGAKGSHLNNPPEKSEESFNLMHLKSSIDLNAPSVLLFSKCIGAIESIGQKENTIQIRQHKSSLGCNLKCHKLQI